MTKTEIDQLISELSSAVEKAKPYIDSVNKIESKLISICEDFMDNCYHIICLCDRKLMDVVYDYAKFYPFDIKLSNCNYSFYENEVIIHYNIYPDGYEEDVYTHIPWNYIYDPSALLNCVNEYIDKCNQKKIEKSKKKLEKLQSKINADLTL